MLRYISEFDILFIKCNSLYSDFYWYEIGDVISIGTPKVLYYCIPKPRGDIVAKTRIATEEIYKMINKA